MLWHIELKFYIWLCLTVLQIKFECRQFASIFVGVTLSGLTGNTQLYTCIDKFSWNFKFHVGFFNAFLLCFRKVLYKSSPLKCSRRAYYAPFAVLRYIYRSNAPFWDLEYWKDTVFRTFLLLALTYWAEIFHLTLLKYYRSKFECHHSVSVWLSIHPSIFCTFLQHALTNLAEI